QASKHSAPLECESHYWWQEPPETSGAQRSPYQLDGFVVGHAESSDCCHVLPCRPLGTGTGGVAGAGDERSGPAVCFEHSQFLEFPVRLGDGVGGDPQSVRETADGGEFGT